jgi:hypothetical protein
MNIVFISGPYRAETKAGVGQNIKRAREAALRLWGADTAVICPHLNTAFFDGVQPDIVWLQGDLEILARCDAIYMLKGWKTSFGSVAEHQLATDLELEVMYE